MCDILLFLSKNSMLLLQVAIYCTAGCMHWVFQSIFQQKDRCGGLQQETEGSNATVLKQKSCKLRAGSEIIVVSGICNYE